MIDRRFPILLLALTTTLLVSCNIVGPAMVLLTPPPSTEAQLELNENSTHMFFVDDLRNRMPKRSLRDAIAQSAESALLTEEALPEDKLISAKTAQRAVTADRHGAALPIAEIGRRTGVDVIIYVTIEAWGLSKDGTTSAPFVDGRVKVIDCKNNKRLWPTIEEGYLLRVAPTASQSNLPTGLAERSKLELELARTYGVALAQLFYKHYTEQSVRQ